MRRLGLLALLATSDVTAGSPPKIQITIWAAPASAVGGEAYATPTTGAMIFEQREVDVAANGEVRLTNIASTADPASMQLRDLTEPAASITEQRFLPAAKTPTEIIARRIGEQVTVVTARGETSTGVLRAVDKEALVLELGTGDARHVSVMRREYVQDVRMTGPAHDKPGLLWRIATTRPGKHSIELTYRADGLVWSADYLAVLDEPGKLIDFSAWATIKNSTGATFDNSDITLISGNTAAPSTAKLAKPLAAPSRFVLPHSVQLSGDAVQLELVPPRVGAKARPIVAFEAIADPSGEALDAPNDDCTQNTGTGTGGGHAEVALELDVPAQTALPEGKVRLFRRHGARVDLVGEDQLRSGLGIARIKMSPDTDITGERRAVTCNPDERTHTIHERIEVKVENKGAQPADVVIREFLWRWPVWRIENEDHKGVRAGTQTQEYRVRVAPKSSQTVTYTAVYWW